MITGELKLAMRKNKLFIFKLQQGVTLIVALVMLLVMTSLGITTMTSATLQERMAGNSRQQYIARLNAEFALRQALAQLDSQNLNAISDIQLGDLIANTDGWYAPIQVGVIAPTTVPFANSLTNSSSWATGSDDLNTNSVRINNADANHPRYIVEYLGKNDENKTKQSSSFGRNGPDSTSPIFRITAIGWGSSFHQNSVSVLQSYYIP